MAGWIKLPLGTKVGLNPGDCVLDGHRAPLSTNRVEPPHQFLAHFYCGQTAGCVKMPLGVEVGLSPGDCVRWRPSHRPEKGRSPTQFLAYVYCGQMAGWMNTPLGTEVDLGSGHIVLDGVPVPAKGHSSPPLFGPCLLWPLSPISATAELLFDFHKVV